MLVNSCVPPAVPRMRIPSPQTESKRCRSPGRKHTDRAAR
jgi:hypothetical protein